MVADIINFPTPKGPRGGNVVEFPGGKQKPKDTVIELKNITKDNLLIKVGDSCVISSFMNCIITSLSDNGKIVGSAQETEALVLDGHLLVQEEMKVCSLSYETREDGEEVCFAFLLPANYKSKANVYIKVPVSDLKKKL